MTAQKTITVTRKDTDELRAGADALVLPLAEGQWPGPYKSLDRALDGQLSQLITARTFKAKTGDFLLLTTPKATVLLAGLGPKKDIDPHALRQAGGRTSIHLQSQNLRHAALSTRALPKPVPFIEGFLLSQYRFGRYRKNDAKVLKKLTVLGPRFLQADIRRTRIIVSATHFARDLVNTPANDMTPTLLARAARSIPGLMVKVLGRAQAEKLGMGAYLAVARGSDEPPRFIVATYRGGKGTKAAPVVLVGKSITFDSGGISLKPGDGMEKMKYDMAGGAAVLGALRAASELKLPVHAVGILPATENLPGGTATRPGDVVTALDGTTVEVINTDAEGRLVLADALAYARRLRPAALVDIATLTGACSAALGTEAVALMGTDEPLVARLQKAADRSGERVWRMPLYPEYLDATRSDLADLKNTAGRRGSLVTAAAFLQGFAKDTPWAHLDIAGTAWTETGRPEAPRGATGVGVRLLADLLANWS